MKMSNINETIEGLEWILEGDKFGFGENWEDAEKEEAVCDEELAGWYITQAIKWIKEYRGVISTVASGTIDNWTDICKAVLSYRAAYITNEEENQNENH